MTELGRQRAALALARAALQASQLDDAAGRVTGRLAGSSIEVRASYLGLVVEARHRGPAHAFALAAAGGAEAEGLVDMTVGDARFDAQWTVQALSAHMARHVLAPALRARVMGLDGLRVSSPLPGLLRLEHCDVRHARELTALAAELAVRIDSYGGSDGDSPYRLAEARPLERESAHLEQRRHRAAASERGRGRGRRAAPWLVIVAGAAAAAATIGYLVLA